MQRARDFVTLSSKMGCLCQISSFKDQTKWVNPRKLCLLNIAGLTEAHKILPLRRGSGCKAPPKWRSYLQLITFGKGKISHTPGQTPYPGSGWPNKMDSVIRVCGPFVLIFHLNRFFFNFVLFWFDFCFFIVVLEGKNEVRWGGYGRHWGRGSYQNVYEKKSIFLCLKIGFFFHTV